VLAGGPRHFRKEPDMILRHVFTCSNDDAEPPRAVHLVVEPGQPPMLQHGSYDYPIDERGLRALADLLTSHGYAVQAPGAMLQPAPDGSCGYGWHETRDGQPVTHICVRQAGQRHGADHVCACYRSITVPR
jgi:hypothetical protein